MKLAFIMPEKQSAADRIAAAYDPEFLRRAGNELIKLVTDYLRQMQQRTGPVLNWSEPSGNVEAARQFLRSAPNAAPSIEQFSQLAASILERGQNLHHPRYMGHQVPAPIPLAGLFQGLAAMTNQLITIYEMGPWGSAVERAVIEELGECLGFPRGQFAGVVTNGGSLANLTALLTARNVALRDVWKHGLASQSAAPVLVVQSDVHYCIARAAGILGLGTDQVIKVALDGQRRMDPAALEALLSQFQSEGRPVIAVVASSCATPIGAFDRLEEIAPICRKFGVWLHVDAAHGASACLSDQHRHLVAGLEQADSVVWDAHKMMFMPALCAFVFYRDARHRFAAFQQEAPYLFDPTAPDLAEYDAGLMMVECTKQASVFGLWAVWSLFGKQLFADLIDVTFALGRRFYELLRDADDFTPLHEPQCNIVVFRHTPERLRNASAEELGRYQLALRRTVIESGEFYLVPTQFEGTGALRVTLINPLTTEVDLQGLLDCLRETGRSMEGP